ncbi:T9SS type A sorting domain-containing protein [Flavobacterium sp. HSC-61S13]|uniref:T9SS type A sorting domain-containing protein n=1 Tax=Flavobacterium sp. HSC-61S13 TaxID=2910963 RepID=UPI0020A0C6E2|nr:T9SS type A sorting domain-containing protein [Flavobacterium sp. HSC-61S13]MCP1994998.1 hypothetical protein [Flavobacterium sp. HSC-61S13]
MKKLIVFVFFAVFFSAFGQNAILVFDYDESGNQIFRGFREENTENSTFSLLKEDGVSVVNSNIMLNNAIVTAGSLGFTYYPNPVKDLFTINWPTPDIIVDNIRIYTTSGQFVQSANQLKGKQQVQLDFSNLPIGWYRVVCIYNDNQEVQFQVIKK